MKIAALADLHYGVSSAGLVRQWLDGVEREVDVLVLPGDLTNTGLPSEMEILLRELGPLALPKVAILGNHDHESGHAEDLVQMLRSEDICVLDGSTCEIEGVGFAGIKGFCGGFGRLAVDPFGEESLKEFVRASIEDAHRLERALSQLKSPRKIVALHYAPVKETLEGEEPELYPFLGCSRLADAIDHYEVDAAVHGHAHNGSPFGRTPRQVPVYNVSRSVLARKGPHKCYRLIEV
ncbi:MAG: metallophosphoesterase [bacterium]